MKIEKLEETKKANKGITLIALVITIIVLLILAGISIVTLTGENGVLEKATNAKNDTIIAEEKEQIKLAYNAALTEKLEKGETVITASELQIELDNLQAETTTQDGNPIKITYTKTGNRYKLDIMKGEISKINLSNVVSFSIENEAYNEKLLFEVEEGTTWEEFLKNNYPFTTKESYYGWMYESDNNINENEIAFITTESTTAQDFLGSWLKNKEKTIIRKDMVIENGEYIVEKENIDNIARISWESAVRFYSEEKISFTINWLSISESELTPLKKNIR